MKIMWCGTASLLLESGGTRLLVDPYLRPYDRTGAPFPAEEARTADAVFAEELGLQLFPYLDDYSCELYVHLEPCAEKNV